MKKDSGIGVYETKIAEPGAAAWMAGSNYRAAKLKTMRRKRRLSPLATVLTLLAVATAAVCIILLLT